MNTRVFSVGLTALFLLLLTVSNACQGPVHAEPRDLASSADADVRRVAAIEIGESRNARFLDLLQVRLQQDPSPLVRAQCATAIRQIGRSSDAVKETVLRVLQNDPNPLVQQSVMQTIGELGFEEAADDVASRLLNSEHADVRQEAAKTLAQIGSERHYPHLHEALGDNEKRVRYTALETLRNMTSLDGPLNAEWWASELDLEPQGDTG